MDGAVAKQLEKSRADTADFDGTIRLKERLERLLREAAEVQVELSRAASMCRAASMTGRLAPFRFEAFRRYNVERGGRFDERRVAGLLYHLDVLRHVLAWR